MAIVPTTDMVSGSPQAQCIFIVQAKSHVPQTSISNPIVKKLPHFFFPIKKTKNLKAPQLWIDLPIIMRVKNKSHQGESVPAGGHSWALETSLRVCEGGWHWV